MASQHTENLFRRYKGEVLNIKTLSGGLYKGLLHEITNDYISLVDRESGDETQTFLFYQAIESFIVIQKSSG
jgi:hypothetical protein